MVGTDMFDERFRPVPHSPIRIVRLLRLCLQRDLKLALKVKQNVKVGEDVVGGIERDHPVRQ